MLGYFENSSDFYLPQLDLAATPLLGNLRENYLHWQTSVEIVCVLRGSVTVEVNGSAHLLQPGDVLTIEACQPHRYYGGTADGLQMMMTIDSAMLRREAQECYTLATVGAQALPRDAAVFDELRSSIGRLCELLMPLKQLTFRQKQLPPVSGLTWHLAHMETHRIAALLSEHIRTEERELRTIPAEFLRCIAYIHEHYDRQCTAAQVARACGFSERFLRRLFQQHMEQSFSGYLTTVRLVAARSLLENTDCSMADAAASIGLSTSSFYRVFHQAVGMSPREYQARIRRNDAWAFSSLDLSMPLMQRNIFVSVPAAGVDWDWIAGRKGWNFT